MTTSVQSSLPFPSLSFPLLCRTARTLPLLLLYRTSPPCPRREPANSQLNTDHKHSSNVFIYNFSFPPLSFPLLSFLFFPKSSQKPSQARPKKKESSTLYCLHVDSVILQVRFPTTYCSSSYSIHEHSKETRKISYDTPVMYTRVLIYTSPKKKGKKERERQDHGTSSGSSIVEGELRVEIMTLFTTGGIKYVYSSSTPRHPSPLFSSLPLSLPSSLPQPG